MISQEDKEQCQNVPWHNPIAELVCNESKAMMSSHEDSLWKFLYMAYMMSRPRQNRQPFFFFLCADFKGKLFWILYQNEPNMHSVGMWVTGCMMNLVLRKCIELSVEFCGHKFHVGLMIILTEPLNVLGPLHTREAFVE